MVAIELNPIIKANVIYWISDSLILNRIEAGNFYKELTRAVSQFKDADYIKLAMALNYCIFGKHETGIRNYGTKEELKQLQDLESKMAFAINMGYINSFDMLLEELRRIYKDNQPSNDN